MFLETILLEQFSHTHVDLTNWMMIFTFSSMQLQITDGYLSLNQLKNAGIPILNELWKYAKEQENNSYNC